MGGQGAAQHHLVTEGAGEVLLWDFFAELSTRPSRRGGPLGHKRCTRASKFLRFYLFCDAHVHLLLRRAFAAMHLCCGTPFAAMYLCCGAPVTARSSCSHVPWLPLQPIQSCPRAAFGYNAWCFVPLAQWIRASASGAEGRRFESCKGHQIGQPGLLHAARVFLYESLGAPSQRFAVTRFLRISAVGMRWLCLMLCLSVLCTGHTMAR